MPLFTFKMASAAVPEVESSSKAENTTLALTPLAKEDGPRKRAGDNFIRGLGYAIKPFFSTEHRTAITQKCIANALSTLMEDRNQEQGEEDRGLTVREVVHTSQRYDWSRALQTRLRWNRLFLLFTVHLQRAAPSAFAQLRSRDFSIPPETYASLFTAPLQPLSNLGLSGSAFFHTANTSTNNSAGLIIKSINRPFEFEFLHLTLLPEYIAYFDKIQEGSRGDSLLTRITDVIYCPDATLGGMLRLSPRHYMVMVDILGDIKAVEGAKKWDLKPMFFEPTRDLVPDNLKSEATKSGLADKLDVDVRIKLTKPQYNSLMNIMRKDTEFLQRLGIVDYSLLFGRWPSSLKDRIPFPLGLEDQAFFSPRKMMNKAKTILEAVKHGQDNETEADREGIEASADFIRGIESADGQWIYRLTIVDFLWNVTKLVPTMMRTAGKAVLMPDQTITTEPETYRTAFLEMVEEYIEVIDG